LAKNNDSDQKRWEIDEKMQAIQCGNFTNDDGVNIGCADPNRYRSSICKMARCEKFNAVAYERPVLTI
jgi:hypothetical protein